jgi:hypothetical protein
MDGPFSYSQYDVSIYYDKAIVTLNKTTAGDLYRASIYGRPIILDLNRSCFVRNEDEITAYGTAALNVTGSYFSEDMVPDKMSDALQERPQYEDWVIRELADRVREKREFTIKTHKAFFNARIGAKVQIKTGDGLFTGVINELSFRYRRHEAFIATFKVQGQ